MRYGEIERRLNNRLFRRCLDRLVRGRRTNTKDTEMKYDWITIAIENGGVLTTSKNVHGIASTMHWKGQEPVCGERCSTLPDALTSLNSALEDDASEEVCPSKSVLTQPDIV